MLGVQRTKAMVTDLVHANYCPRTEDTIRTLAQVLARVFAESDWVSLLSIKPPASARGAAAAAGHPALLHIRHQTLPPTPQWP